MKRTAFFSASKILPFLTVAAFAFLLMILVVMGERRAYTSDQPATASAQATPTPFPCQPIATTCPNPPVVTVNSSQVPCDVCVPTNFPGNPIAFFDDYSWRAFIALVWPANTQYNNRGIPDTTQTVGGKGPLVFETYKALWEVFHQDGSAPVAWNQNEPASVNACGVAAGPGDLVLASFSKFSDLGQAGFGTLVGPLVAQNQTYVSFLTAYNQFEFDEIVNNKWFLRANLPSTITFDLGSLDVKSAWMDMTNAKNPQRYYTRSAWVMDPMTGQCSQKTVGLVGLHIVQKTPSRPQWIWSTFEQIDNVPPPAPGAPGTFAFNDGTSTPMPAKNPYPINPLPTPVPPPYNVTRTKPIHSSTVNTNKLYQKALASQGSGVWQYYQLVMTQWPVPGNAPTNPGTPQFSFPGSGATTSFANVTLETFDQASVGTGCMACHTITQKQTDFLWSLADHAFPPKIPSLVVKEPSFRELRTLIESTRPPLVPDSKSRPRPTPRPK